MNTPVEGERTVSEVASTRKPWLSRGQRIAAILLVTASVIGFVFWKNPGHHDGQVDTHPTESSIGQVVPYEAPKPPAIVPVSARAPIAPPAPPPLPPPQPLLPAINAATHPTQELHHPAMLSFAVSQQSSPSSLGGTPHDPGSTATHVMFKGSEIPGAKTGTIADRDLVLMPGLFRCTLDTAIDSTLPGPIMCHLPQDVLSPNGVVLMDKGTRIVGEYKNNIQQGQGRLFTMAATAYTPNGVVVPLDGPMADGLGRTGLDGDVDNHYLQRFGGAVLLSLVDGGLSLGQAALSKGNNTYLSIQSGDTSGLAEEILRNTINIPPTITVPQGKDVTIWVRYPIDFSPSYRLGLRR
jgi:type IV secretion system protein VirB10